MSKRNSKRGVVVGDKTWQQGDMFGASAADLPLFSGACVTVQEPAPEPETVQAAQLTLGAGVVDSASIAPINTLEGDDTVDAVTDETGGHGWSDYAEWNVADDKIKYYPAARLSDEEYKRVTAAGFAWWGGSQCFAAKWTPGRVDLLREMFGVTVEDVEEEDDAEARAERFEGYAGNAAARSRAAFNGVHRITDMIPLGQPILVGHHSERRARRDAERIESGMRKGSEEYKKAEYWQRRARATVARAERREEPGAISRRIEELERDRRKHVRDMTPTGLKDKQGNVWMEGRYWVKESSVPRIVAECERWIEHIDTRLAYERALYEASGGTFAEQKAAEGVKPEVGGLVLARGDWCEVLRVNPKTVTMRIIGGPCAGWEFKRPFAEIKAIKSKAEADAIRAKVAEAEAAAK